MVKKAALIALGIPLLAYAQNSFVFNIGDFIRVISDKGYWKRDDIMEAVGNVVMTHKSAAIYGEKATLDKRASTAEFFGNVRYVAPDMTLYGSELFFNYKTSYLNVKNSRMVTPNYVLWGDELERISPFEYRAKNAEYSTCKDCPESWSVYGRKIRIIPGQYIFITHGLIKIRGVVAFYFPYMVFPIKKNRETGLLFPSFGYKVDEGVRFQQPWFWAISQHNDATITPSIWGKRAYGGEFEFRQAIGERKWFEISSLSAFDKIYAPDKDSLDETGHTAYRHFSDYEHHFDFGNWLNHHFYYSLASDLDTIVDYDRFTNLRTPTTSYGGGGYVDMKTSLFNMGFEGERRRNLIIDSSEASDRAYVQVMPRIFFDVTPLTLLKTDLPGLRGLFLGLGADYTVFRQRDKKEASYIRNANRFNSTPYLIWDLGNFGPIEVKEEVSFDYQNYYFPYEKEERHFYKTGAVLETEMTLKIDKVFGLAYIDNVPVDRIDLEKWEEEKERKEEQKELDKINAGLVGKIPQYENAYSNDVQVLRNSFRHDQQFRLKHYYMIDQRLRGNETFRRQIDPNDVITINKQDDEGNLVYKTSNGVKTPETLNVNNFNQGLFDIFDAPRSKADVSSYYNDSVDTLPLNNTLELGWENYIIKKSPQGNVDPFADHRFLRQNFSYSEVASFRVSQGYDFQYLPTKDEKEQGLKKNFLNSLTRLAILSHFSVKNTSISSENYYLWRNKKRKFSLGVTQGIPSFGSVGLGLTYSKFKLDEEKNVSLNATLTAIPTITLSSTLGYDIVIDKMSYNTYQLDYAPRNDCWKIGLSFLRERLNSGKYNQEIGFNFYLSFAGGGNWVNITNASGQ